MTHRPQYNMRLEGRATMTFALRQALEILQMPQLELGQWLLNAIEKNPLIEIIERPTRPYCDMDLPATISLRERLLQQIRDTLSSNLERHIAQQLLELLDEKGFLPPESVTATSDPLVRQVLSVLQTFDPPGVFARNLQESFLIQLKIIGKMDSPSYLVVKECFDDFLHSRYEKIKKQLQILELGDVIQTLSRLSRRPAEVLATEPVSPIIPDLRMEPVDGGWTVELIEDHLPQLHLRQDYLSLEPATKEEKFVLRELKTEAKWILRSLSRRRKLILEIGRYLLCKQAHFIDQKGPLSLITTKALAEKHELHESTISRILQGKYVATPRGVIALRSLVSSIPETVGAKELLAKLVQGEDKQAPLTDQQLATKLTDLGMVISRRTIAKYRIQLKIGAANQRKNAFTNRP